MDIQTFFMKHNYLNSSVIAERAGIKASLLRLYMTGAVLPDKTTLKQIQKIVRQICRELTKVDLVVDLKAK